MLYCPHSVASARVKFTSAPLLVLYAMVDIVPGGLPNSPAIEATLITRPERRGTIEARPIACVSRNTARMFRFITLSHASGGCSSAGAPQVAPALLTRMSTWPRRAIDSSARRATCDGSEESAAIQLAEPSFDSRSTAASSSSALRADTTTRAPISMNPSAICSPSPREPPVTSAVRPVRSSRCFSDMSSPSGFVVHALALEADGADERLHGDVLRMVLVRIERRLVREHRIQHHVVGGFEARARQRDLE